MSTMYADLNVSDKTSEVLERFENSDSQYLELTLWDKKHNYDGYYPTRQWDMSYSRDANGKAVLIKQVRYFKSNGKTQTMTIPNRDLVYVPSKKALLSA